MCLSIYFTLQLTKRKKKALIKDTVFLQGDERKM